MTTVAEEIPEQVVSTEPTPTKRARQKVSTPSGRRGAAKKANANRESAPAEKGRPGRKKSIETVQKALEREIELKEKYRETIKEVRASLNEALKRQKVLEQAEQTLAKIAEDGEMIKQCISQWEKDYFQKPSRKPGPKKRKRGRPRKVAVA
jgi:AT hook motif.